MTVLIDCESRNEACGTHSGRSESSSSKGNRGNASCGCYSNAVTSNYSVDGSCGSPTNFASYAVNECENSAVVASA